MRYYLHVVNDQERIVDYDGEEFPNLDSAREEATQAARDLIAEELRCGRRVPWRWRMQVAQEDGTILHTVLFAPLLLADGDQGRSRPPPKTLPPDLIARAKANFAFARTTNAEIKTHLTELRNGLHALHQLNRAFSAQVRGPRDPTMPDS